MCLSGRGAFNQIGAIIGTIMVANVFAVIIPNQKKIVAALLAGQTPDPKLGKQSKQRSVHNNYLTLPVIVLMISNHYPLMFATRYNWLIVAIVLALGPSSGISSTSAMRDGNRRGGCGAWRRCRHDRDRGYCRRPVPGRSRRARCRAADFATVQDIVLSRCSMCHAAEPVFDGITAAPKGIRLDDTEHIRRNSRLIGRNAAWSSAMPPGNITEMTGEERAVLAAWLADPAR